MKLNTPTARPVITTHEGAPARHIKPLDQLRRSVCSCLLWEKELLRERRDDREAHRDARA